MDNISVADIMTRDPITVKPDTNLLNCVKKMVKKRLGSLLVVEKKKLIGLVSHYDILWAIIKKSEKDLEKINAVDVSRKKIVTIRPKATVKEAFNKMKKLKLSRLPVIQDKELVGMLTIRDILNFNPEFYPELDELSRIREESEKLKRIKKRMSEGICEECGNHNLLFKSEGTMICESCMDS